MSKSFRRFIPIFLACCLAMLSFGNPMPAAASSPQSLPANEFTAALVYDDSAVTLDPALAYDTVSGQIIQQIYEGLITFNREKTDEFVPQLASSWEISADHTQYTFHIRTGVLFHGGQALTAEDVAYSFQRGILQGGGNSPQWMMTEPFLGIGIKDITGIVDGYASWDNRDSLKLNDPAVLQAACELVKTKIVPDNAAGTVTLHLAQAWSPMLVTLAGTWGSVVSQSWVAAQGGWDGSCGTWQNYYASTITEDPLTAAANGTGPFKLDHWTAGVEIGLVKNLTYWRTTPMWLGGPSGLAKFDQVTYANAGSASTQADMLIAGSADYAPVSGPYYENLNTHVLLRYRYDGSFKGMGVTGGTLSTYEDGVGITGQVLLFNYAITNPSPYVGTGTWGSGIPLNFFSDIHVRKAFNYAFDWNQFISQAYNGYALQMYGPIIKPLQGYADSQPHYSYNPTLAAAEMNLAFGGQAAANGFTLMCLHNGVAYRQVSCDLLKVGIEALDPEKYHVLVLGVDWNTYLQAQTAGTLPLLTAGWMQDMPHPYNWLEPYLSGTYANRQHMPQDLKDKYAAKMSACLGQLGDAARLCYEDIQTSTYDDALNIFMAQNKVIFYFNAAVKGYYYNPGYTGLYIYALSKSILGQEISMDTATPVFFTDEAGNEVSFTFPAVNNLTENIWLEILPDIVTLPLGGDLLSGSLAFNMQGFLSNGQPSEFHFDSFPVPVTIHYVNSAVIESTLRLYYWDGADWVDAACGEYVREPESNTLTVPICHFSQFQLGGETNRGYLPTIRR